MPCTLVIGAADTSRQGHYKSASAVREVNLSILSARVRAAAMDTFLIFRKWQVGLPTVGASCSLRIVVAARAKCA